jgi:hypothetical protein
LNELEIRICKRAETGLYKRETKNMRTDEMLEGVGRKINEENLSAERKEKQ